jgi:hypothetical protein
MAERPLSNQLHEARIMNQEIVDMAVVAIRNTLREMHKPVGPLNLRALDKVHEKFPGYFQAALHRLVDLSFLTWSGGRSFALTEEGFLWLWT